VCIECDARTRNAAWSGIVRELEALRDNRPHYWNLFVESHHMNHLDSDGHEDTENRAACPICRILDGNR